MSIDGTITDAPGNRRLRVRASLIFAALLAIFAVTLLYRPKQPVVRSAEPAAPEAFVVCLNSGTNFIESDNIYSLYAGVEFTEMKLIILNLRKNPLTNVWLSMKISSNLTNRVQPNDWVQIKSDALYTEFGLKDAVPMPQAREYTIFNMDTTGLTTFGAFLYVGGGGVTYTSRIHFLFVTNGITGFASGAGAEARLRTIAGDKYDRQMLITR